LFNDDVLTAEFIQHQMRWKDDIEWGVDKSLDRLRKTAEVLLGYTLTCLRFEQDTYKSSGEVAIFLPPDLQDYFL
jgi:hypothetical protein